MEYNRRGNDFGSMLRSSPEFRAMLHAKGRLVQAGYRQRVAKRSGELARSVSTSTHLGGVKNDRLVETVTVSASYAASHEFGTTRQRGYHELLQALQDAR